MKTFPGWRQIGELMRWARTSGATVTLHRDVPAHYFPDGTYSVYVTHRWSFGSGPAFVRVGSYAGRTDPDLEVSDGRTRRTLYPKSADEALKVIDDLGVFPPEMIATAVAL